MLSLEEKAPSARLVFAAGVLIVGELVGFSARALADVWAWMGFFALTAILAAYGWGIRRVGYVALFVLGALLALRTEATLKDVEDANTGVFGPRPPLDVPVEGPVTCRRNEKTGRRSIDFISRVGPVGLKVIMPLPDGGRVPQMGEVWRVDGWISRARNWSDRYNRRTLWVPQAARVRCVEVVRRDSVRAGWSAASEDLARRAGVGLAWCPELAALNRAILLGRRNELPKAWKRAFVDAGTIHVFAISGLHVMVVAWLLNTALTTVCLPSCARGLVCLPLVWAYVVLTGVRPSAVRAATMVSLFLVASVLGRRPDALAAWSVTALGVYALSPERLFDLGCTLSFVVMFGIVIWCHWSRHFRPWFREGSRWRKCFDGLGVSFAAWVAGVPVAAYAFGRFTPGGLLANVVVIFCVQWMVRLGAGGLVMSFACLPLAAALNNGTAALTWIMAFISEKVAALPFSSFSVRPWTLPMCVLWYAMWVLVLGVLGTVLPRKGRESKKWWR
ncbi:MAG: ComEC/Rec2 family competence protein [bacterium]|nr:ComEC/Rec2 family competence protein [bacterium]